MISPFKNDQTVRIHKLKDSLNLIKKSIAKVLPGGIRGKHENGRGFMSHYITMNMKKWDVSVEEKFRAFVEITILGDRRPYTLEINVRVQEKKSTNPVDQDFRYVGDSLRLAETIAHRLRSELEYRRDKRDLIEDFRVF